MLSLTNIKKINSLFIGTNTCFKKYLEKSKRLFVRKTYTTSYKLAAAAKFDELHKTEKKVIAVPFFSVN